MRRRRPWSASGVRKHRAPKGALRLAVRAVDAFNFGWSESKSAIRCIKTRAADASPGWREEVRKHRAPKGALRPGSYLAWCSSGRKSERTERQKAH